MNPPRSPINTPRKVKMARKYLGLDKAGLARALRITSAHGRETVRRLESGDHTRGIPGPVQLALEYLVEKASNKAERQTP